MGRFVLFTNALSFRHFLSAIHQPHDFLLDIPDSLLQVFDFLVQILLTAAPEILDGVADAEVLVLRDGDALDTGRMVAVVRGIDGVFVDWIFFPLIEAFFFFSVVRLALRCQVAGMTEVKVAFHSTVGYVINCLTSYILVASITDYWHISFQFLVYRNGCRSTFLNPGGLITFFIELITT